VSFFSSFAFAQSDLEVFEMAVKPLFYIVDLSIHIPSWSGIWVVLNIKYIFHIATGLRRGY
jgi:hypothetical protein